MRKQKHFEEMKNTHKSRHCSENKNNPPKNVHFILFFTCIQPGARTRGGEKITLSYAVAASGTAIAHLTKEISLKVKGREGVVKIVATRF